MLKDTFDFSFLNFIQNVKNKKRRQKKVKDIFLNISLLKKNFQNDVTLWSKSEYYIYKR